jgi:hypothetical protein
MPPWRVAGQLLRGGKTKRMPKGNVETGIGIITVACCVKMSERRTI